MIKKLLMFFRKLIKIKRCQQINLKDKNFSFWKCTGETPQVIYFSYGIDRTKEKAKKKAIFECIERYFISFNKEQREKMVLKSYSEIREKALHPTLIFPFLDIQYSQEKFKYSKLKENDKIYWVKGKSFFKNEEIFVPACAVYCQYKRAKSEPSIGRATSNGCAVGRSFFTTILNASLELIERDAVLIRWFNKLPSPRIKFDFLPNNIKHIIKTTEKHYCVKVLINDLTLDSEIPVVSVLLQSSRPPYFTFGSAAEFSIKKAIIKALQESLLIRYELRNARSQNSKRRNFSYIQNLYQHAEFYAENNVYEAFRFLYESPFLSTKKLNNYENIYNKIKTIKEKFNYLKSYCKKLKTDIIFIDLTPRELKYYKLYILRVIIPGFLPLNSEYNARYLGCKRLYSLPVQLGFEKNLSKKFHKFPHPI
ncbi:MAG: YcaO-like family protein [Candidatus Omnitrophica bacterium]|nr:YcaO-like family protein [Candidatus Omnitrophota bacterium]